MPARGARAARARAARHAWSAPATTGSSWRCASRRPRRRGCGSRFPTSDGVALELEADGDAAAAGARMGPPLRGAARRAGRAARHRSSTRRAATSSSAPTAATPGPTARRSCSPEGGIPQGDCAPVPWLLSSRGYAVWVQTEANGTRFDLSASGSRSRPARSRRAAASCSCCATARPAARLRQLCRLTGFPALLPEWGYGFWKSRDVYEHQDDVLDDFDGFRRPRDPARRDRDRLAVGDPVQHLEVQPAPVPRRPRDDRGDARATGVRTVVWVTPWVNLDSRDGQIPPQPGSERLHREPAPNYAAGRRPRALRAQRRRVPASRS